MKIYIHELTDNGKITTVEKEAEEKPKTYFVHKRYGVERIPKTDINKLQGRWSYFIYVLEPDVDRFKNAVIEALDRVIYSKEKSLQATIKQKENIILINTLESGVKTDV